MPNINLIQTIPWGDRHQVDEQDLLAVVTDPNADLATRKNVTLTNFRNVAYGSIYCKDASAAQSPTTTPAALTAFTAAGVSSGVTAVPASDKLTIVTAGDYRVHFHASGLFAVTKLFTFNITVDTTASVLQAEVLMADADKGSVVIDGFLTLAAGDDLSVYTESSEGGGAAHTIVNAVLSAELIS